MSGYNNLKRFNMEKPKQETIEKIDNEYKLPKNWKEDIYTHSPAILSLDEVKNPNVDETILYYYINSKGDRIDCNAMYLRDNDMVVVRNQNGCQVCLHKKDLYFCKN